MQTKTKVKFSAKMKTETALFAAGCFWGVEAAFQHVNGVVSTQVGHAGGRTSNPTYKDVCSGDTGHAESVIVEFDPKKISYGELLDIFWTAHDPTQLNRHSESQYRSAVFYQDEKQKIVAIKSLKKEQKKHSSAIVTEIMPAPRFWRAEEYHQKYNEKHGISVC